MKLTKKQLISAAIVTALAGGIGLTGVASVSAQQAQQDDGSSSLADRLATKFNLNKDEVKTEIDAEHEARHAERETEMKQNRETQLQKLVDAGTITADQKAAIIAKQDEIHTKMEELKNNGKTRDENKDAMEALRDEFETWAESQGINLDDIRPADGGRGGKGKHGGPMSSDDQNNDQATQDSQN
jgi:hypothetical protein